MAIPSLRFSLAPRSSPNTTTAPRPNSPGNEYIYAGSVRVAIIQSGTTYYWLNDHLSPRMRTDASGNVADERGTFAFGETWYPSGSTAPWMFTTYYRDVEANGNDYAQARTYAGVAAGGYFLGYTEAYSREFSGRVTQDSEGFFTYNLESVGAVCPRGADCFAGFPQSPADVAIWHTHIYENDIIQFLGDRMPVVPTPTDYVTTPMGSGMGSFQVGAWSGGVLVGGPYGPAPPSPEMFGPPQVAPICKLSGPSFPGISHCH